MLYLEKRTNKSKTGKTSVRWYIRGVCPYTGEPVRESTTSSDRGAAADILAIRLEQRRQRALHGDKGTATFADCVVNYLGIGGEERFIDPLLDEFGKLTMGAITDKRIGDFIAKRYLTAKPATIVRQVFVPLEAIWRAAVAATPPLAIPRTFQKPKVVRAPPKYAKHDNVLEKILRAIPNVERRAGVLFMSFSGRRSSEVADVLVEDYDPEAATITVSDTKNNDPQVVALPPFVNEVCRMLDLSDPKARLFGFPSRFAVYSELKRAARRAGLDFLSPHKLGRHTFAARFLRDGNSLASLKEAGGWRSVNAVMVYAHLEKKNVDAAIRNIKTPLRTDDGVTVDAQSDKVARLPKRQGSGNT